MKWIDENWHRLKNVEIMTSDGKGWMSTETVDISDVEIIKEITEKMLEMEKQILNLIPPNNDDIIKQMVRIPKGAEGELK